VLLKPAAEPNGDIMHTEKYLGVLLVVLSYTLSIGVQASSDVKMRTLMPESVTHGVYIAPFFSLSPFGPNDEFGVSPGVQIGWTLNKNFTIGLKASQLWKNIEATWIRKQLPHYLNCSYAGAFFSYTFMPDALVHAEFYTLIGGGLAGYRIQTFGDFDNLEDDFIILEPGVVIETNVTRFMRIGMGLSHQVVQGIELKNMKDVDFSGLSFSAIMKVGLFK
jgi:hypothetical protein